jgi:hypothetical protein
MLWIKFRSNQQQPIQQVKQQPSMKYLTKFLKNIRVSLTFGIITILPLLVTLIFPFKGLAKYVIYFSYWDGRTLSMKVIKMIVFHRN